MNVPTVIVSCVIHESALTAPTGKLRFPSLSCEAMMPETRRWEMSQIPPPKINCHMCLVYHVELVTLNNHTCLNVFRVLHCWKSSFSVLAVSYHKIPKSLQDRGFFTDSSVKLRLFSLSKGFLIFFGRSISMIFRWEKKAKIPSPRTENSLHGSLWQGRQSREWMIW